MYRWRTLTNTEKEEVRKYRKQSKFPKHSPIHQESDSKHYHLTAACYEHKPIMGHSITRMLDFSIELKKTITNNNGNIFSWCVLPNHYHVLIYSEDIKLMIRKLGELHGRSSFEWNGEEDKRGRQVWYNAVDRGIRSEQHYWVTVNYIHNNPVRHGYVSKWQDWLFSSAEEYLKELGRDKVLEIWNAYPVLDYGKGWDDPSL